MQKAWPVPQIQSLLSTSGLLHNPLMMMLGDFLLWKAAFHSSKALSFEFLASFLESIMMHLNMNLVLNFIDDILLIVLLILIAIGQTHLPRLL